jgi:hypothetical protein
MKGYFLIKEKEYIDIIDDGKNQSILKLKGKNNEIIQFNLNKDRVFTHMSAKMLCSLFFLEGSM